MKKADICCEWSEGSASFGEMSTFNIYWMNFMLLYVHVLGKTCWYLLWPKNEGFHLAIVLVGWYKSCGFHLAIILEGWSKNCGFHLAIILVGWSKNRGFHLAVILVEWMRFFVWGEGYSWHLLDEIEADLHTCSGWKKMILVVSGVNAVLRLGRGWILKSTGWISWYFTYM